MQSPLPQPSLIAKTRAMLTGDETTSNSKPPYHSIKIAVWIYFGLWLFEGSLRKWILPELATPLLVVRDPLAIAILFMAFKQQLPFLNKYIYVAWISTIIAAIATLTMGHKNLFVSLFGARIMLLHFPLIFIIGKVFTKVDIEKVGRIVLLLTPLMSVLVALQFNSPQSAWVNRGVGGNPNGAGFDEILGYYRPPGTFSFIIGLSSFYPLAAVSVLYFWLSKATCNRLVLFLAAASMLFVLPLTISRAAVFWVLAVGVAAILGVFIQNKTVTYLKLFNLILIIGLLFLVFENSALFQVGLEVFSARIEKANHGGTLKESMGLRMVDQLIGPLLQLKTYPVIDGRLGMGTSAGAALMGKSGFLISEDEVSRLFGERGLILGLIVYGCRAVLLIFLGIDVLKSLAKKQLLPLLYFALVFFCLSRQQWGSPTCLGFSVIATGFFIASLNTPSKTI